MLTIAQILKVHAQWLVIGDSGRAYDIEQDYVWQVNDKGVLYPRISPSGPGWSGPNWDYVPFPRMRPVKDGVPVLTVEPPPGPYYDRCDDGQLLVIVGACPEQDAFSNDYRESAKAYYAYKGWELPLVEYQVHHLKPRSHGGNNSNQNLVALTTEQHTPFTTWWLSFKELRVKT